MASLELELFGEESDGETSPPRRTRSSDERKADSVNDEPVNGTAKRKRVNETHVLDPKVYANGKHSAQHNEWAPFQTSDDVTETRHNNTGKDIPTNAQIKTVCGNGTIQIDFNDHSQLRAWLKIHLQPSGGKYAALAERVQDYINAHGLEVDDWYGIVKAKQKMASMKPKKKQQTKADVLARAQKAFEEASRAGV